jgi:hypothetical protein
MIKQIVKIKFKSQADLDVVLKVAKMVKMDMKDYVTRAVYEMTASLIKQSEEMAKRRAEEQKNAAATDRVIEGDSGETPASQDASPAILAEANENEPQSTDGN